ncbi:MAG: hypothetical protein ACI9XK_004741 [Granulosicoccus sp.]|jgi:hypothetical protein
MFKQEVGDFAESLFGANDLDEAFAIFNAETRRLGFEAMLYTYIPKIIIHDEGALIPVFQVSNISPAYLSHYKEARFDKYDPLIKAVTDGACDPIEWWGDLCKSYTSADTKGKEVMEVARDYKINNGVTLPLLSGPQGIAGASFITEDRLGFDLLLQEKLPQLQLVTNIYSNLVLANSGYIGQFITPVFASLNTLEIKFLAGLAKGKSQAEMATELSRSGKYLEQVMLKIRRKVSGVGEFAKPTINRNQLMYYVGLANLIEYADSL